MQKAAELDMPISLHEEDPAFIKNNGINHGVVSEKCGIDGSPSIAEESLVARDCTSASPFRRRCCDPTHQLRNFVDLVRMFKSCGAKLHAEATPHHFTLTEDAVLEHGTCKNEIPLLRYPNRPHGDH